MRTYKNENYYTVDKVVEIISEFHTYEARLKAFDDERIPSVGVAQYGIESVMPRANSVSSGVESAAINLTFMPKMMSNMITDMKYLQDRWYRVTDDEDAAVLQLRLSGASTIEIARLFGVDQRTVQRRLRRIAETIMSYPQVSVATVAG